MSFIPWQHRQDRRIPAPPTNLRGARARLLLILAIPLVIVGVPLLSTGTALAEEPFRMGSQIEDRVGALEGREAEVRAALDELQAEEQVQLWLAYVDSFSGQGAQDWADETAVESDLGLTDVLLAVAVGDRAYSYSVDQDFPLDGAALTEVMSVAVEPALIENDWAGAAIGGAQGMAEALRGESVTPPIVQPGEPIDTGGSFPYAAVIGVIILVVVVVAIWAWVKRSRRAGKTPAGNQTAPPALTLAELRSKASAALVETDDAVKSSTNEVGFAAAQFGEDQAAPFQQALDQARTELAEAFKLHREVDQTDDEQEQRRLLTVLLEHTDKANERLDAQSARFDQLRDLEKNAPQVLAQLEQKLARLETRVPQAREELARLGGVYSSAALASVQANPDEAVERIAFSREQVRAGLEDVAAGQGGAAAVTILAAEEAAAQAESMLDAVGRLGRDLSEARGRIEAAIAETRRDITEARGSRDAARLTSLVATAEAAVTAASSAASPQGGEDPLASLRYLEEADTALEEALQDVREADARRVKAVASLERSLVAARAEIATAEDYITTHRGAVGSGPRTLLAEAKRDVNQALMLADTDPVAAAHHAAAAHQAAGRALSGARQEVEQAMGGGFGGFPGMGGMGGSSGGGVMGGMGGAIAGAIIGGILSGGLSGGGSSFGGGGGFSPPSFGGTGTRMRRGGGGRF